MTKFDSALFYASGIICGVFLTRLTPTETTVVQYSLLWILKILGYGLTGVGVLACLLMISYYINELKNYIKRRRYRKYKL